MKTRSRRLLTIAGALGGLVLFTYSVRRAGVVDIVGGIRRVGWGLVPILFVAGVRFVLRAEAWRLCTPAGTRLPHGRAFMAFLAGDSIGNLTPLGLIASEPTKVVLIRHHLATRESVTSLALDNLVYSASVVMMVALGVIVMLATVPLSFAWREWSVAALGALAVAGSVGVWVLRRGLPWNVLDMSVVQSRRVWRVLAVDMTFHALAVFEAYLTLQWLLGSLAPTFTEALLFEVLNRVVTVAFKFVPLRVGVDEAASGAFAPLLSVSSTAGVALAVIRKVRNLFWMGIGLTLIGVHHAQGAPATDRRETVPVHRP
jgi:glycosyltransferase 2 family protein